MERKLREAAEDLKTCQDNLKELLRRINELVDLSRYLSGNAGLSHANKAGLEMFMNSKLSELTTAVFLIERRVASALQSIHETQHMTHDDELPGAEELT
jgi:hypothetical protein